MINGIEFRMQTRFRSQLLLFASYPCVISCNWLLIVFGSRINKKNLLDKATHNKHFFKRTVITHETHLFNLYVTVVSERSTFTHQQLQNVCHAPMNVAMGDAFSHR
jgi:hypothetical protein